MHEGTASDQTSDESKNVPLRPVRSPKLLHVSLEDRLLFCHLNPTADTQANGFWASRVARQKPTEVLRGDAGFLNGALC